MAEWYLPFLPIVSLFYAPEFWSCWRRGAQINQRIKEMNAELEDQGYDPLPQSEVQKMREAAYAASELGSLSADWDAPA